MKTYSPVGHEVDEKTQRALDALDSMAEDWAQSVDLAAMVASILLNLPTAEFEARARLSISGMIKQAYVEGLYSGRCSHSVEARH